MAESPAPIIVSLIMPERIDTLLSFALNSPLAFLEKKVGESRKVRAMMEFWV